MKGKMKLSTARNICVLWIVVIFGSVFVGFFSRAEGALGLGVEIAIGLTVLYTVFRLIFWRCPHCGRILGRGLRIDGKCYYCEKDIRD